MLQASAHLVTAAVVVVVVVVATAVHAAIGRGYHKPWLDLFGAFRERQASLAELGRQLLPPTI